MLIKMEKLTTSEEEDSSLEIDDKLRAMMEQFVRTNLHEVGGPLSGVQREYLRTLSLPLDDMNVQPWIREEFYACYVVLFNIKLGSRSNQNFMFGRTKHHI